MSSELYITQQIINAISLGSLYALVAIGLSMIFGILRMTNFNSAVDVCQFDVRPAAAEFAAQVVAHELVMVHMQTEIVIDSARNRAGLEFRLGVGRNGQFH